MKVIGREGGSRLGARGIWGSGGREVVQCDLTLFFFLRERKISFRLRRGRGEREREEFGRGGGGARVRSKNFYGG